MRFKKLLPLLVAGGVLFLGGLAYLTIDHYGIEALISTVGVAGVAGIIFAESGLLIGFFLPGDSLLFTAGFLVHQNILHFNIHLLTAILFLAAVLGDSVGYSFGRRAGHRLFNRKDSVVFHQENLHRAEEFYERHGAKTIIIARFVPVVRTFAPIVAGISKMHYRTFLTFNLIGALLWAVGLTYLGYFAGKLITDTGINIEYVILGIILLSILPPLIHIFKEKKNRTAIMNTLRSQWNAIFKKD
ncbi:DedA family protein [Candidatus Saccharibacteria bacterium]|nr:MAG: DedA family protein [Candidatus Saccharibacteria bacterium]